MTIEVDGIGRMRHQIVPGEHEVDYVGSGMDGSWDPQR